MVYPRGVPSWSLRSSIEGLAGGAAADVDIAQMLRNDLDVLHCDIRMLVMRLLELFQLFGHSNSVTELVTYCPKVRA